MQTRNSIVTGLLALAAIAVILAVVGAGKASAAISTISPANLFQISGTQITPIYPTWSFNIPLSLPNNFRAASSTSPGGSLSTSSAPIYFQVAAINRTGTTTPSTEIATTTKTGSSRIHFSWTPVPGATGYAVYYSTTTPGGENAYQLATTTNQYDLTSTSSPLYGRPPAFPSAFAAQLSNGTSSISANGFNLTPFATTTVPIGGGALCGRRMHDRDLNTCLWQYRFLIDGIHDNAAEISRQWSGGEQLRTQHHAGRNTSLYAHRQHAHFNPI